MSPDDRGATVVADRVVEKIAAAAAVEVDHAAGLRRRVGARTPAVRVRADRDGDVTALRMQLAVAFPVPVRTVTRAVRAHVADTVGRLCGLRVDHIDLTVAALRPPEIDRRRVQ